MMDIEGMIISKGEVIQIPFEDIDMFYGIAVERGYRIETYADEDILIAEGEIDDTIQ
jgi:hypothetical protein